MSRLATIREVIVDNYSRRPFRPFAVNFENGDRVIVEHPENIAFHVTQPNRDYIFILSEKLRYSGPMSAITTVAELDTGELT